MIHTLAISNYRSINKVVLSLSRLNVVTGANGSGKSNLYRALRLLANTAQAGIVAPLAREGGLSSVMWAGPASFTRAMRAGEAPIEGSMRGGDPVRMRLGFAGESFGYAVTVGLPAPQQSAFALDPEYKTEAIWAGPFLRPSSVLIERKNAVVRRKTGQNWDILTRRLPAYDSLFAQIGHDDKSPEVLEVRETLRSWRFYDHFRTDSNAPARQPQLGTRTPVLSHDGKDLAAALQTIREIGDPAALDDAIDDAFPGSRLEIVAESGGMFTVALHQHGLLRPLTAAELSDGTLRYLLLVAALLTPRPPLLMVLNEPESSLHPDLLPALGRLISKVSTLTQVWVVTHSTRLCATLETEDDCTSIVLNKTLSETEIVGQSSLNRPAWHWPD